MNNSLEFEVELHKSDRIIVSFSNGVFSDLELIQLHVLTESVAISNHYSSSVLMQSVLLNSQSSSIFGSVIVDIYSHSCSDHNSKQQCIDLITVPHLTFRHWFYGNLQQLFH